MGTFFVYILKSGICMVLFYLFYRLLLSRETFHRFNRIALLCLSALAIGLPFIRYSSPTPAKVQVTSDFIGAVHVTMEMPEIVAQQTASPLLIYIIVGIYLAGVLFFLLRTLWSFAGLFRLFRSGRSYQQDGIRVIVTTRPVAPFSWMNHIVLSQADWEENRKEIITHETGHIRCGHSWDLLLAQLCVVFHWFNPAVWLLKQELQTIHEYEADEYVLYKGIDAKNYQLLLIKKAVGTQRFTSMANSFNHSKLKKRITMMLKGKSNPWARMKYLYVLPVSILVTTAFARPELSNEFKKISAVKISEIISIDEIRQDKNPRIRVEGMAIDQGKEPFKDETSIKEYGEKGTNEVIPDTTKKAKPENEPLVVMDGKEISKEEMNALDPAAIQSISVIKDSVEGYGEKAENGVILITTQEPEAAPRNLLDGKEIFTEELARLNPSTMRFQKRVTRITTKRQPVKVFSPKKDQSPIFILDGVEITEEEFKSIDHETIESISVLKDETSTKIYGEKGKNGVVLITLKKKKSLQN